jgi:hypothetical protein
VNAYIAGQQAVAVQQKRPAGVRLQPVGTGAGVLEIVGLETPPPYAGDTIDAKCLITSASGGTIQANLSGASLIGSLGIGAGDTIRLNYRGPYYPITGVSGGSVTFSYNGNPPAVNSQHPYQIHRKPIRSTAAPLQLPRGVCVDLSYSGEGPTGTWGSNEVIDVMYTSDGRVFYYRTLGAVTTPVVPQGSLYFLVGRTENFAQAAQLEDLANRWVSVRALSGQCITFENQGGGTVTTARTLAATAQGMGGH